MPDQEPNSNPHYDESPPPKPWRAFFEDYFWFLLKNLLGWILMLAAWPIGIIVPGPGGIPLFLIGFALVTFPGKRRLTARVLRGRRIQPRSRPLQLLALVLAVFAPPLLSWLYYDRHIPLDRIEDWGWMGRIVFWLAAAAAMWLLVQLAYRVINVMLYGMPKGRRLIRPWMRDHGVRLLPPRHKRRHGHLPVGVAALEDEIIEIHDRLHRKLRLAWVVMRPWLRRLLTLTLLAAILYWMFRPLFREQEDWPFISQRLGQIGWWRFIVAALMFSAFLFFIRATSWRWILQGLGVRLPVAPATRIWSASELARYIPGVIWQVVGRVYLSRPYGVSTAVSSVSQVLELTIFVFANILVAVCCLLWFGYRQLSPDAQPRLLAAMAMIPVLLVILHPPIFYRLMNGILGVFKKPQIQQRLGGPALIGLVLWAVLGLLWQSLAVWLVVSQPLDLPLSKWWVVAGAYCLAWTVGFTFGALMPGGLVVREAMFVATLRVILPDPVRQAIADPVALAGLLAFLSLLLRLWATTGELLLAGIAHLADYRGALGKPDAPGRVNSTAEDVQRITPGP